MRTNLQKMSIPLVKWHSGERERAGPDKDRETWVFIM